VKKGEKNKDKVKVSKDSLRIFGKPSHRYVPNINLTIIIIITSSDIIIIITSSDIHHFTDTID
jgi:hypothetical protein